MKKRTAICLLSSLVAITAASTSVSVAWYATASVLRVEEINVTLSTFNPLLISTKNEKGTFKPELKYEDLKQVEAFEPVTSILQDEWLSKKSKNPVLYQTFNNRATTIVHTSDNAYAEPFNNVATEGYYSQELYLYAENDYYAMIDVEETKFEPNVLANRARAEKLAQDRGGSKTVDEYFEELNRLVDSIRFSVLVDTPTKYDYKIFDPYKNQSVTKLGGIIDTSTNGHYDAAGIGDNRYETLYGDVNDRNLIKYYDSPQPEIIIPNPTWYRSNHDSTAKQIDFDKSYANGLVIKQEDALSLSEYGALKEKIMNRKASQEEISKTLLIPIKTMIPTRIVLSIYFEGFDIDNINETMSASFSSKITFDVIDAHMI